MKTSEQLNSIAEALAKAQGEFTNPEKNRTVEVKTRTGGSYHFAYATLDQILEITRPILSKHGLSVVQVVEKDEGLTLTSRLLHGSGQWIESNLPLHVEGDGVQALGSAISYLRRYGIISLLGLAAEEDDDGNRSDGNQATGRDRQPYRGQQQPQEQRREAPKGPPAPTGTTNKSTPLANTPAASGTTDPRPQKLDEANPKTSCEAWFRNIAKQVGEKCASAIWKTTVDGGWQHRFDTLKDIHLACENIRRVLGEKPGGDLIHGIVTNIDWDEAGIQSIRRDLVKASEGEITTGTAVNTASQGGN